MKIWLLSHTFYPARGGIENYLREAGKNLARMGHQPFILCRRNRPDLAGEEEYEGIQIIRHPDFPVPRSRLFSKHLYLADRISSWLGETTFCREGWAVCRYPHYQYALSSLSGRCPSVFLPASLWPALAPLAAAGGNFKERFFELCWRRQVTSLERKALSESDRLMVFSRNMRSQLEHFYRIDPRTVFINPPGVDDGRFHPRGSRPGNPAYLDLAPETPRILFLGRFSPEKNLLFLLRELASPLREARAALLLAGDGPRRRKLEKTIRRMNLSGAVRFLTALRPEEIYPLGDIFVSPSRYESFGQSILEAMASGLPVVALKSSPPRILTAAEEIIEEGASGYTVPPDPSAFRKRIEELLASPGLRRRMGQRGREICRERFSWERHFADLLGLMKTASGGDGNAG